MFSGPLTPLAIENLFVSCVPDPDGKRQLIQFVIGDRKIGVVRAQLRELVLCGSWRTNDSWKKESRVILKHVTSASLQM